MLNIGIFELLIIFIVGLIFLSPQDLIACIKAIKKFKTKIGQFYHKTNEYFQEVTEVDEDITTLLHKGLNQPNEHIHKMFNYEFLSKEKGFSDPKKSNDENSNKVFLPPDSDSKDTSET